MVVLKVLKRKSAAWFAAVEEADVEFETDLKPLRQGLGNLENSADSDTFVVRILMMLLLDLV